jgi:hypothetical protein
VVHGGKIIDGRNRALACEKAGVEPNYLPFDGADEEVGRFIISMNIHRRHLTASQKRDLLKKLLKMSPEQSDRTIATIAKVSPTTVGEVRREANVQTGHKERIEKSGRKARGRKPGSQSKKTKSPDRGASETEQTLYCSFCGKSQHEVPQLIAGPTVFICNECVDLCTDITKDLPRAKPIKPTDPKDCLARVKAILTEAMQQLDPARCLELIEALRDMLGELYVQQQVAEANRLQAEKLVEALAEKSGHQDDVCAELSAANAMNKLH